jgi:hypothetical protein
MGAWALFVIHLACVAISWPMRGSALPHEPGIVVVLPSNSELVYLYVVSAVAGFVAILLGMIVSMSRAVRQCWTDSSRRGGE